MSLSYRDRSTKFNNIKLNFRNFREKKRYLNFQVFFKKYRIGEGEGINLLDYFLQKLIFFVPLKVAFALPASETLERLSKIDTFYSLQTTFS